MSIELVKLLEPFLLASTGQGIKESEDEIPKSDVAESVKQEVFIKTANTEPIEIDRLRKCEVV